MKASQSKNMAASVHQKLVRLSKDRGDDPNLILIHYAVERFLYRLSQTKEAKRFILKGAMLFYVWTEKPHRPTRDLDLLAIGDSSSERIYKFIQTICNLRVIDDGLFFDETSITIKKIKQEDVYDGFNIQLNAYLGKARITVKVDIAFGDIVTPEVLMIEYPTLLNSPVLKLLSYPYESVIAEKFHSIVVLGMANSRMKDYYDLFIMINEFKFQNPVLKNAIENTFQCRQTDIPSSLPIGLSNEFAHNDLKQKQWAGFLKRNKIQDASKTLGTVVNSLGLFFAPLFSWSKI